MHLLAGLDQRRHVVGERVEPGRLQLPAGAVDQQARADLDDDAACADPLRAWAKDSLRCLGSRHCGFCCRGGVRHRYSTWRRQISAARLRAARAVGFRLHRRFPAPCLCLRRSPRQRSQRLRTPRPDTAESSSGFLRAAALSAARVRCEGIRIQRVALRQRHDLLLLLQPRAVGLELGAHGAVGAGDVLAGRIDQVQQHAAALDVAEEARAEPGAFVRALDQARNVGQHEVEARRAHHAEVGMQRGEGVVGDLRLGGAHRGEERRLAGIGQPDDAGVGDQLEPQPDRQLLARLARIGAARRLVGRRLEVRVAEAAVAALGEARALAGLDAARRAASPGPRRRPACPAAP